MTFYFVESDDDDFEISNADVLGIHTGYSVAKSPIGRYTHLPIDTKLNTLNWYRFMSYTTGYLYKTLSDDDVCVLILKGYVVIKVQEHQLGTLEKW